MHRDTGAALEPAQFAQLDFEAINAAASGLSVVDFVVGTAIR